MSPMDFRYTDERSLMNRTCPTCGKKLVQKERESEIRFTVRAFCGNGCYRQAMAKKRRKR